MTCYLTQITEDYLQYTEVDLVFRMIYTDCVGQEKNGILASFSGNKEVANQIAQVNITLVLYLCLINKKSKELGESGDWTKSAAWACITHCKY